MRGIRLKSYVDEAHQGPLARLGIRVVWEAEEDLLAPDPERADLFDSAEDLASEARLLVTSAYLPREPLRRQVYMGAGGQAVLVGPCRDVKAKIRLCRWSVALLFPRKWRGGGETKDPVDAVEALLSEALTLPLPAPPAEVERYRAPAGAVRVAFRTPPGHGFGGGRFDCLNVYTDPRVILMGFSTPCEPFGPHLPEDRRSVARAGDRMAEPVRR